MADIEGLVTLDDDQCWDLLGVGVVGRLAFVDAEGQQILPVNYAVQDGAVHLRTAVGSSLAALATGHDDVAFQVDERDTLYQLAWSVTVRGRIAEQDDADVLARLGDRPRPWAPGVRDVVLTVTPRSVAGRRIRHH